jgi:hypothetical protein
MNCSEFCEKVDCRFIGIVEEGTMHAWARVVGFKAHSLGDVTGAIALLFDG